MAGPHRRVAPGFQTPDGGMQGFRFRDVLQFGVVLDGARIEIGGQLEPVEQFQQALLLTAERRSARTGGEEQGLDTERITGQEQRSGVGVPDGEGEHTAQRRTASGPQ